VNEKGWKTEDVVIPGPESMR